MDQILEKHNLQKLTQEGRGNINSIIFIKEIESIFNKLPKEKAQAQMDSLVNSTKYLKKKLYQFSTVFSRI